MCVPDVIGVFTMLLNVLALRSRARQAEILKRTVTISDASGASMDIALWGERATTFPAEQVHKDGQTTLQVMIFVGTLVKCYTTTQLRIPGHRSGRSQYLSVQVAARYLCAKC